MADNEPHLDATPVSRWRRFRRRACRTAVVLVVILAAVALAYHMLTDPARVRRWVVRTLQRNLDAQVAVSAAEFSWPDQLKLSGLTIADAPADFGFVRPLLSCPQLSLRISIGQLLRGRLSLRELTMAKPSCQAVFDVNAGRFNVQRLFSGHRPAGPGLLDDATVRIEDADLSLIRREGHAERAVESLRLDVVARPDEAAPGDAEISWATRTRRLSAGHLRVRPATGELVEVHGNTPWLSAESALLMIQAFDAKTGNRLAAGGLAGVWRLVGADEGMSSAAAPRFTIEVQEGEASLPVNAQEETLPPENRFLRLDRAGLKLKAFAERAELEFSARLAGAPCHGNAVLRGPLAPSAVADLGVEFNAEVEGLLLPRNDPRAAPAEARLISRWKQVRYLYNDFDPHGPVDLSLSLIRAPGPGQPLRLGELVVTARGGDASCRRFPYLVSNLHGRLVVNERGIFVEDLGGDHDGGRVSASGWSSGARWDNPLTLYLTGRAIALDDALCDSITGRYRTLWEQFQPRGWADLDVILSRPAGSATQPEPMTTTISARIYEGEACFVGFPYPVKNLGGTVYVGDDAIAVNDLRGRAGNAWVGVDGAARITDHGLENLDLGIRAQGLRIDERLLAALSPATRAQLARFAPAGPVNFDGRLSVAGPDQPLEHYFAVELDGIDGTPIGFPLPVSDLRGRALLRPNALEFADLRGRIAGGTARAGGRLRLENDRPQGEFRVAGRNLCFDESAEAALPPGLRDVLAPWRLQATLDVDAAWSGSRADAGSSGWNAQVELRDARLSHQDFPLPWHDLLGRIALDGNVVHLDGLEARHDAAHARLRGTIIVNQAETRVELAGQVGPLSFTEELRQALPWRLRRLWNNAEPTGAFDLDVARLAYALPAGDSPPAWEVQGAVAVTTVGLRVGPRLERLTGSIDWLGEATGPFSAMSVVADARLAEAGLGNYELHDLQARLLRDGRDGRWGVVDARARLYGGEVTGEAEFRPLPQQTQYSLRAVVEHAGLDGLVNAGLPADAASSPSPITGELSGRLYLTGLSDEAAARRGGGEMHIRGGQLYRLPGLLTILDVLKLSPPEEAAVHEASAGFLIVGDEVQFQDLVFQAPGLAMIGRGTLQLTTMALNLSLIAASPQSERVPILSELVEGASRQLMEVSVTGTPRRPVAEARPLRGMTAAVDQLLVPPPAPENAEPRRRRPPAAKP